MKKFGPKLSLSRLTLEIVSGGVDNTVYPSCYSCGGTCWDSDVVKLRIGDPVKK